MMAAETLKPGMPLSQLLADWASVPIAADVRVTGIALDSRQVRPGDVFVACRGEQADGRAFIADALHAGAVAVLLEDAVPETLARQNVAAVSVPDLAQRVGAIAARFYGDPSQAMNVIGVTGTNGKTSITSYVAQALGAAVGDCGVFGTLGYGPYRQLQPATTTTPDPITLQRLLAELRAAAVANVVMEVSSHALAQARVAGTAFDIAVFTNLSRDHLDYHADMADYAAAKRRLFAWPGLRHALINVDDDFGRTLLQEQTDAQRLAYSLEDSSADLYAQIRARDRQSMTLAVTTPWGQGEFSASLSGSFNAANLLASLGVLCLSGVAFDTALACLAQIQPAPGRMQSFGGDGQPLVVVDYAHTPAALALVLAGLRADCGGELWCVFGCGGDRDRGKRPLMAQAAEAHADRLLVTSDNPRFESPQQIVAEICAGLQQHRQVRVEVDRAAAIRHAIEHAAPADTILIAGKGHEDYQDIAGVRQPFSDSQIVQQCLRERS